MWPFVTFVEDEAVFIESDFFFPSGRFEIDTNVHTYSHFTIYPANHLDCF